MTSSTAKGKASTKSTAANSVKDAESKPGRQRRRARIDVTVAAAPKPAELMLPPAPQSSRPDSKRAKAKPARQRTERRMSALDAAAQVLSVLNAKQASEGLSAVDLVDRMQSAGLWTSPGGKTPASTLYAAITREIAAKQSASRFMRIAPGRFSAAIASTPPRTPRPSAGRGVPA